MSRESRKDIVFQLTNIANDYSCVTEMLNCLMTLDESIKQKKGKPIPIEAFPNYYITFKIYNITKQLRSSLIKNVLFLGRFNK